MVFQSYALYPSMTVRGNLSFGLKMAGAPKPEIEHAVRVASGGNPPIFDGVHS
jgi:ABC-type sugar transport system ATPase subunit